MFLCAYAMLTQCFNFVVNINVIGKNHSASAKARKTFVGGASMSYADEGIDVARRKLLFIVGFLLFIDFSGWPPCKKRKCEVLCDILAQTGQQVGRITGLEAQCARR